MSLELPSVCRRVANSAASAQANGDRPGRNMASMPDHFRPQGIAAKGEIRHNPGHVIDLVPTILEVAGGKRATVLNGAPVPKPPGKSLQPAFAKDGAVSHDDLWWLHEGNRAVRVGVWKLVSAKGDKWALYNLRTDRAESKDMSKKHPDKVRELEAAWKKRFEEFSRLVTE